MDLTRRIKEAFELYSISESMSLLDLQENVLNLISEFAKDMSEKLDEIEKILKESDNKL